MRLEGASLALMQAVLATARIVVTGRLVTKTEPIVLATQMLVGHRSWRLWRHHSWIGRSRMAAWRGSRYSGRALQGFAATLA